LLLQLAAPVIKYQQHYCTVSCCKPFKCLTTFCWCCWRTYR